MFFYVILTVLFSLLLGILGIGNNKIDSGFKDLYGEEEQVIACELAGLTAATDENTAAALKKAQALNPDVTEVAECVDGGYPGAEYK